MRQASSGPPRVLAELVIGLAATLLGSVARAEDPPASPSATAAPVQASVDPIVRARTALEDLRYEDAIGAVAPLLDAKSPRARVQALEITAVAHLILGQMVEAQQALTRLYETAPGFRLHDPSLPPRVTGAFEAEAARPHRRGVTPLLRGVASERTTFELLAGGEVARVDLACRATPSEPFVPVATDRRASSHRFRLPTPRAHRCFAVALDRDELPLGWLGSRKEPFAVEPKPERPQSPSVLGRWWFWGSVGAVVVAGAAVVVVVATQPAQAPPSAGVTVTGRPVRWAW
jgi:hypothetical protein